MNPASFRPVLLIEDDPNDLFLLKRAFQKGLGTDNILTTRNGEEAIQYLKSLVITESDSPQERSAEVEDAEIPSLILLDLKMPRKSGLEVLQWIQSQPLIKRIPTIVLSSSKAHVDVNRAYDLGANSYIVKPLEFQKMTEIVEMIGAYWLKTVRAANLH